jgi:hypothetical protein
MKKQKYHVENDIQSITTERQNLEEQGKALRKKVHFFTNLLILPFMY